VNAFEEEARQIALEEQEMGAFLLEPGPLLEARGFEGGPPLKEPLRNSARIRRCKIDSLRKRSQPCAPQRGNIRQREQRLPTRKSERRRNQTAGNNQWSLVRLVNNYEIALS
jgi:hypothetical protein